MLEKIGLKPNFTNASLLFCSAATLIAGRNLFMAAGCKMRGKIAEWFEEQNVAAWYKAGDNYLKKAKKDAVRDLTILAGAITAASLRFNKETQNSFVNAIQENPVTAKDYSGLILMALLTGAYVLKKLYDMRQLPIVPLAIRFQSLIRKWFSVSQETFSLENRITEKRIELLEETGKLLDKLHHLNFWGKDENDQRKAGSAYFQVLCKVTEELKNHADQYDALAKWIGHHMSYGKDPYKWGWYQYKDLDKQNFDFEFNGAFAEFNALRFVLDSNFVKKCIKKYNNTISIQNVFNKIVNADSENEKKIDLTPLTTILEKSREYFENNKDCFFSRHNMDVGKKLDIDCQKNIARYLSGEDMQALHITRKNAPNLLKNFTLPELLELEKRKIDYKQYVKNEMANRLNRSDNIELHKSFLQSLDLKDLLVIRDVSPNGFLLANDELVERLNKKEISLKKLDAICHQNKDKSDFYLGFYLNRRDTGDLLVKFLGASAVKLLHLDLKYHIFDDLKFLKNFPNLEGIDLSYSTIHGDVKPLINCNKIKSINLEKLKINCNVDCNVDYFCALVNKFSDKINLKGFEIINDESINFGGLLKLNFYIKDPSIKRLFVEALNFYFEDFENSNIDNFKTLFTHPYGIKNNIISLKDILDFLGENSSEINTLHLINLKNLTDLSDLPKFNSVKSLFLNGCDQVTNIKLDDFCGIDTVFLDNCSGIMDLSFIAKLPLIEQICIANCPNIADFNPLLNCPCLKRVYCDSIQFPEEIRQELCDRGVEVTGSQKIQTNEESSQSLLGFH